MKRPSRDSMHVLINVSVCLLNTLKRPYLCVQPNLQISPFLCRAASEKNSNLSHPLEPPAPVSPLGSCSVSLVGARRPSPTFFSLTAPSQGAWSWPGPASFGEPCLSETSACHRRHRRRLGENAVGGRRSGNSSVWSHRRSGLRVRKMLSAAGQLHGKRQT